MIYSCWYCDAPNDCHRQYNGVETPPNPGDVSLCHHCGYLGVFTEDGTRQPTPAEASQLAAQPEVLAAVRRWDAGEDLRR